MTLLFMSWWTENREHVFYFLNPTHESKQRLLRDNRQADTLVCWHMPAWVNVQATEHGLFKHCEGLQHEATMWTKPLAAYCAHNAPTGMAVLTALLLSSLHIQFCAIQAQTLRLQRAWALCRLSCACFARQWSTIQCRYRKRSVPYLSLSYNKTIYNSRSSALKNAAAVSFRFELHYHLRHNEERKTNIRSK